ncbi:hypothetical protein ACCS96_48275, partial [Rhizobium ruizarguesonis]
MREQPIGEAVEDDAWPASDVMWPPEKEIGVSEAHASLAKAVAGSRGVRYFTAFIIDVPSDAYLGDVQLSIEEAAGAACVILLTTNVSGR